jgi:hypothetical protein
MFCYNGSYYSLISLIEHTFTNRPKPEDTGYSIGQSHINTRKESDSARHNADDALADWLKTVGGLSWPIKWPAHAVSNQSASAPPLCTYIIQCSKC